MRVARVFTQADVLLFTFLFCCKQQKRKFMVSILKFIFQKILRIINLEYIFRLFYWSITHLFLLFQFWTISDIVLACGPRRVESNWLIFKPMNLPVYLANNWITKFQSWNHRYWRNELYTSFPMHSLACVGVWVGRIKALRCRIKV